MENNRDYTRRSRRRRELTPREKLLIILKRNIYPIALVVIIIFSIVVILPAEKSREAKKEVTASITENKNKTAQKETETTTNKNTKVYKTIKPKTRTTEKIVAELKERSKHDEKYKKIYDRIDEYPKGMLNAVLNNPEMQDFLIGYPDNQYTLKNLKTQSDESEETTLTEAETVQETTAQDSNEEIDLSDIKITEKERKSAHPLFIQWDERWAYIPYGDENIGMAGCGPTCMSMVIVGLTHNSEATPAEIARHSEESGYYVNGQGTSWLLMSQVAKNYGITVNQMAVSQIEMENALDNGNMLICSVGAGDFTTQGHFIVIYGYTDEGFLVNDPYCKVRSTKKWSFDRIKNQIKTIWRYSY